MANSLTRQLIAENYRNPHNNFKPESYTHSHELANRSCGDEIKVFVNATETKITSIHYEIRGCALSTATASILSQELAGKPIEEIKKLNEQDIQDILEIELSINRIKCALLPLRAIQQATGIDKIGLINHNEE